MKNIKKKPGIRVQYFWRNCKEKLNNIGAKITESELIKFDYRVLTVIFVALLMFIAAVTFKISGSSVAEWNKYFGNYNQREGLIMGTSKAIRSDEWFITTTSVLGQKEQGLPIHNANVGANNDPLLTNMPVKHITAVVRPQFWGYFFLDSERAFSFHWNFKVFGLIISSFLLLLLLTKNNFWASLFGALWLYFSSFMQWWFSSLMPDTTILFCLILVTGIYFLVSQKRQIIYLSSLLLACSITNFFLLLYPPLQVPFGYLMLFVLVGYFLRNTKKSWPLFKNNLIVRVFSGAIVIILMAVVLHKFYIDGKSTIQAITDTVYPGKRISIGGGLNIYRVFSGFYSNFFRQINVPLGSSWGNICEASTFILLSPLFIFFVANKFIKQKKIDSLVLSLIIFSLLQFLWLLFPFPEWFAKISLLSYVTANRALLPLGVASIFLSVIVLSDKTNFSLRTNKITKYIIIFAVFILIVFVGRKISVELPDSGVMRYIFPVSLMFAVLTWMLFANKRVLFYISFLIIIVIPNCLINPITHGMSPIYDKGIARHLANIPDGDKKSLWVVYGAFIYPNYFESFGINVFNSVKYTPDLVSMTVLDPEKKSVSVYNRYAIIQFIPQTSNQKDIDFKLIQSDLYSITISPCNPALKKIGVKYLVFDTSSTNYDTSCLIPTMEQPVDGFSIYELR